MGDQAHTTKKMDLVCLLACSLVNGAFVCALIPATGDDFCVWAAAAIVYQDTSLKSRRDMG